MAGESFTGTDFDLQACVEFEDFRSVAAFGAFECVAACVVLEGLCILLPVLERLAERKAQMIAVNHRGRRRGLRGTHPLQLPVFEPVGLQVREAPPGVAVTAASGRRRVILGDGLRAPPERLERVSDRQMQISRLRGAGQ